MAGKDTPTLPESLRSPQERQGAQLLGDVVALLEKHGASFSELKDSVQKDIAGQAAEIAKLSSTVADLQTTAQQRFAALAAEHRQGGSYRGPFSSREEAAEFGRLVAALVSRNGAALAEAQKAGITPGTGPEGGYLLRETLLDGILRDVEEAGVFERNCPALTVGTLKGGSGKRTQGLTVYYPDFGEAATLSTPGVGRTNFDLKRYVVACNVDNWMLASELTAALGDFVALEIAYALRLAEDTNWFMGDGSSAYCGATGLFKRTDLSRITADSGDDTLAEVTAKSTYYLAKMLGTLPTWGHMSQPKWFMHLLTFFGYLGVRDTTGQPIANILTQQSAPAFFLMGYPVEPVQVAPSVTAVSTVFALFGALRRACRVYRHRGAVTLKSTDQLRWLEAETTFAADVPQDMTVVNGEGVVQLATAGS